MGSILAVFVIFGIIAYGTKTETMSGWNPYGVSDLPISITYVYGIPIRGKTCEGTPIYYGDPRLNINTNRIVW